MGRNVTRCSRYSRTRETQRPSVVNVKSEMCYDNDYVSVCAFRPAATTITTKERKKKRYSNLCIVKWTGFCCKSNTHTRTDIDRAIARIGVFYRLCSVSYSFGREQLFISTTFSSSLTLIGLSSMRWNGVDSGWTVWTSHVCMQRILHSTETTTSRFRLNFVDIIRVLHQCVASKDNKHNVNYTKRQQNGKI